MRKEGENKSMGTPEVSIVIPAYNHEKYVGEAIQSVLGQTFPDFELIIINDGSTDHTEAEILKFEDDRIRYYSQENRGLSATLNRGIELAQGEYFSFLPSDDAFLPEKLEVQLKAFEESEDIGVVFSYQNVIDGEGNEIKDDPVVEWFQVPFETKEEIFPALFERDFLSFPTALIRMECFKKVGPFDESLKTAQDYDLWMRILKHYDLRLVKRPLLKLRWHGANLTYRTTAETEEERAKVLLKAYKNLAVEDIFPSQGQRRDALGYAEACDKLAGHMEKSGLSALLSIAQIYKDWANWIRSSKMDDRAFYGKERGAAFDLRPLMGDSGRIHVLIEVPSLDKGGMEEVVYSLATHLDPALFRVIIVCVERGGHIERRLRREGFPVEILGEEKEREYREIIRRYRIDLVNTHYSHLGPPIAYEDGIPVISVIHSIYNWVSNKLFDDFKRVDSYVSKYIAVSEDAARYAQYWFNISRDRIEVIPDGIDLKRFSGKKPVLGRKDIGMNEEDFIFLHVGAVSQAKMHNLVVAALKVLSDRFQSIKVISLGQILEEDYYRFIERRIAEEKLQDRIKLIGFVESIQDYYQLSDGFLLPSLVEGWGLATLEAMYYGLPLVLTRVGGAKTLVEDEDIGILINNCVDDIIQLDQSSFRYFAHQDSPENVEELVAAMTDLYKRRQYWREAGKKGKEKVLSRFTVDQLILRYEKEFLRHAVGAKNRRERRLARILSDQRRLLEEEVRKIQQLVSETFNKVLGIEERLQSDKKEFSEKLERTNTIQDQRFGYIEYQLNYILKRLSVGERIRERAGMIMARAKRRVPGPFKKVLKAFCHRFASAKGKKVSSEESPELPERKVYERLMSNFCNFFSLKEIKKDDASLMKYLLSRDWKGIFIYPPTVNWSITLFQRPHQIFRVLAEKGYLSFFCVPEPEKDGVEGLKRVQENLFLCGSGSLLHSFLKDQKVTIWSSWTPHKIFLDYFPRARLIYDFMDELDVFYGFSGSMEEDHDILLRKADLVLTSATSLWEKARKIREDALLVPNGAYLDDFRLETLPVPPPDLAPLLREGKPVIGYYGALAQWLDYPLINYVIQRCRAFNIVLIGPDYDGSMKDLIKGKNLFWLGSKAYCDLKNYLYYFDVAMIPFKVNHVTESTSPVKLFEYMAGGKPIVTTNVRECRKYKSVYIAEDAEDFVQKIGLALERKNDPEYAKLLEKEAKENSWHSRVDLVIEQLNKRGCINHQT